MGIIFAFIAPAIYAVANILDNFLANKAFKSIRTLIFYSSFLNVLFVPFILLFKRPEIPGLESFVYILLIALIEVLYLYPYYKALQKEDTSIVVSLFSLGRIFVPLAAFFIIGERLQAGQYFGFILITVSSALLTLNNKLKINKAFHYMVIASLLIAIQAVLYKQLFNHVDWVTGFIWPTIFSFGIVSILLIFPKARREIKAGFKNFKANLHLFTLEELFTFGASAAGTFAISEIPVSIAKSVGAIQPFVLLIYAIVFEKYFPNIFRENITPGKVLKKIVLFLLMLVGIILIV